jgi:Phycobilisome degradation protein nblA
MNSEAFQLSLEQQFQMRLIEDSADSLNQEQLSDLLMQIYRLLMIKDNLIRDLMKKSLGIND